jgi:hypothetical protein
MLRIWLLRLRSETEVWDGEEVNWDFEGGVERRGEVDIMMGFCGRGRVVWKGLNWFFVSLYCK